MSVFGLYSLKNRRKEQISEGRIPSLVAKYLIVSAASLVFFESAHADTQVMPPREPFLGVRPLGMGGAFVAIPGDENAVFFNPAGIGKNSGSVTGVTFPNFVAAFNAYSLSSYRDYVTSTYSAELEIRELITAAQQDKVMYSRAGMFPTIHFWRVQAGFYADSEALSYFEPLDENETEQKIKLQSRSQTGAVFGMSLPYRDTGISVGLAGRYSMRGTIDRSFTRQDGQVQPADDAGSLLSSVNRTRGLALDVGTSFGSKGNWNPNLSVVARDVGDTVYRPVGASETREIEKMNVAAGMSISPKMGKKMSLLFSFEGNRLTDMRVPVPEKIKVGSELSIGEDSSILAPFRARLGYENAGISFGAGMDFYFFQLEAASFVSKVDNGGSDPIADRRYAIKASVDLGR